MQACSAFRQDAFRPQRSFTVCMCKVRLSWASLLGYMQGWTCVSDSAMLQERYLRHAGLTALLVFLVLLRSRETMRETKGLRVVLAY